MDYQSLPPGELDDEDRKTMGLLERRVAQLTEAWKRKNSEADVASDRAAKARAALAAFGPSAVGTAPPLGRAGSRSVSGSSNGGGSGGGRGGLGTNGAAVADGLASLQASLSSKGMGREIRTMARGRRAREAERHRLKALRQHPAALRRGVDAFPLESPLVQAGHQHQQRQQQQQQQQQAPQETEDQKTEGYF